MLLHYSRHIKNYKLKYFSSFLKFIVIFIRVSSLLLQIIIMISLFAKSIQPHLPIAIPHSNCSSSIASILPKTNRQYYPFRKSRFPDKQRTEGFRSWKSVGVDFTVGTWLNPAEIGRGGTSGIFDDLEWGGRPSGNERYSSIRWRKKETVVDIGDDRIHRIPLNNDSARVTGKGP